MLIQLLSNAIFALDYVFLLMACALDVFNVRDFGWWKVKYAKPVLSLKILNFYMKSERLDLTVDGLLVHVQVAVNF